MSDTTQPNPDLRAILSKIDRDLADSAKLREEANKFTAEQHKLLAEQFKLMAEGNKLNRDRWLAPILAVVSVLGGIAGFVSILITTLHLGR